MSQEFERKPNFLELKNFRLAFEKVKFSKGLRLDIINFAQMPLDGFARVYSQLAPGSTEQNIRDTFETVIGEFIPGATKQSLENLYVQHHDEAQVEWKTNDPNVVLGLVKHQNREGEKVSSWYLRNTSKTRLQKLAGIIKL